MNYEFPTITSIADVLPAIQGRNEFIVSDKGHYTIINYVVVKPDTFDIVPGDEKNSYIRRECRGIAFDKQTGEIISRPFHKFFNVGEREETLPDKVSEFQAYKLYHKMDGSMVRPIRNFDGTDWYFATKMGLSDVAEAANEKFRNHDYYIDVRDQSTQKILSTEFFQNKLKREIAVLMNYGYTPIFEYIAPDNRIVVKYDRSEFVLLAIRHNATGVYVDIPGVERSIDVEFPVLSLLGVDDIHDEMMKLYGDVGFYTTVKHINNLTDAEGIVMRLPDGHMVKMKSDWYLRLHKSKEATSSDRKIMALVINNELDDLLPVLDADDKRNVLDLQDWFWYGYDRKLETIQSVYDEMRKKYGDDRGAFAREQIKSLHPLDVRLIFSLWDGKDLNKVFMDMVTGHLSTEKKWEEFADFLDL